MFYLVMSTLVTLILAGLGVVIANSAPVSTKKRFTMKKNIVYGTTSLIGIQAIIYMMSVGLPVAVGVVLLGSTVAAAIILRSSNV